MDRNQPEVSRRFFKVMMPGFDQKLKLPPAICMGLEKCKSETTILESRLGKWKIGICRDRKNDVMFFQKGWPEFVERHALTVGDFLVFQPIAGKLQFNVCVFDSSACEKLFWAQTQTNNNDKKGASNEALNPTSTTNGGNPHFVKTIAPYNTAKTATVYIPAKFVKENNLGEQTSAALSDPKGRRWSVKVGSRVNEVGARLAMGWLDFYKANALKNGDTCVFTLIPPKLTHTTIFFDVQIFPA